MTDLSPRSHAASKIPFGSQDDLKNTHANNAGFRAVTVTCAELGYQPDCNSIFEVGELLIVQNFGNIVLPDEQGVYQTEIVRLLLKHRLVDVIICGHTTCEPISKFLQPGPRELDWLEYGDELRRLMSSCGTEMLDDNSRSLTATKENILLQAEKVSADAASHDIEVRLHAWSWTSNNRIAIYDPRTNEFQ